jgi:cellulose synthase (UDP-forming)
MSWYYFAGGIRALFGVYGDFHRTPKGKNAHWVHVPRINFALLAGDVFTFLYSFLAILIAFREKNFFFIPINVTGCVGFGMVLCWAWQEKRSAYEPCC